MAIDYLQCTRSLPFLVRINLYKSDNSATDMGLSNNAAYPVVAYVIAMFWGLWSTIRFGGTIRQYGLAFSWQPSASKFESHSCWRFPCESSWISWVFHCRVGVYWRETNGDLDVLAPLYCLLQFWMVFIRAHEGLCFLLFQKYILVHGITTNKTHRLTIMRASAGYKGFDVSFIQPQVEHTLTAQGTEINITV